MRSINRKKGHVRKYKIRGVISLVRRPSRETWRRKLNKKKPRKKS